MDGKLTVRTNAPWPEQAGGSCLHTLRQAADSGQHPEPARGRRHAPLSAGKVTQKTLGKHFSVQLPIDQELVFSMTDTLPLCDTGLPKILLACIAPSPPGPDRAAP